MNHSIRHLLYALLILPALSFAADRAIYYYPGWKSPPEASVTWQGTSPWADYAPNKQWMGDYPHRWPLLGGNADEDSQSIIDSQLNEISDAGFNVIFLNWYQDKFENYALNWIKQSTTAPNVKFALQWDDDPQRSLDQFLAGARAAGVHATSPRYYWHGGRPVLLIFSTANMDALIGTNPTNTQRADLLTQLRQQFASTAGVEPFLVVMNRTWLPITGVDAAADYGNHNIYVSGTGTRAAVSYDEVTTGCSQLWDSGQHAAQTSGKEYWNPVCGPWNHLPWGASTPAAADIDPPTQAKFDDHLAAAEKVTPATGVETFCSYNEWGEGTAMSPNDWNGGNMWRAIVARYGTPH